MAHARDSNACGWLATCIVCTVMTLVCIATLAFLWLEWGDRGLRADATGTSGWSTPLEGAALIGALLGLPTFGVLALVGLVKTLAPARPRAEDPAR